MSTALTTMADLTRRWREGAAPPSDVVDALLAGAAAHDAANHIYIRLLAGRARAAATGAGARLDAWLAEPGGGPLPPLLGLPVVVKDNIDVRGTATTCGSLAFARPVADRDAAIVRQLDALGAVILGKTNLDEAALGASGRNAYFGRCVNPRRPLCLSGGSSSGSAAAVAAGHALLGIGTDTLGSVRIPAALCGIVGFKPTHGLLSTEGVTPLFPAYDDVGLLTANLQDALLAAATLLPAAAHPSGDAPLRLLQLPETALAGVDAGVAEGYRQTLAGLRSAAVSLRECPPLDFAAVSRAALWEVAACFARGWNPDAPGAAPGEELLPLLLRARGLPETQLDAGRVILAGAARQLRSALADADALLTPTCPVAAIGCGSRLPPSISWFAAPANVAGLPAVAWTQWAGEPRELSLQMMGRPGGDLALLRSALKVQSALDLARDY